MRDIDGLSNVMIRFIKSIFRPLFPDFEEVNMRPDMIYQEGYVNLTEGVVQFGELPCCREKTGSMKRFRTKRIEHLSQNCDKYSDRCL
jgi:hypothetical protein